MNISEHVLKRLDLIIGDAYALREVRFMHNFILPGKYPIIWNLGIQVKDILLFSQRCENFGVKFLGLETLYGSDNPLLVYNYENHKLDYNTNWIPNAITDLKFHEVEGNLIPTISVPKQIIEQY